MSLSLADIKRVAEAVRKGSEYAEHYDWPSDFIEATAGGASYCQGCYTLEMGPGVREFLEALTPELCAALVGYVVSPQDERRQARAAIDALLEGGK